MIFTVFITFIAMIINIIFAIVPPIPQFPEDLTIAIYQYFDLIIKNGFGLLSLFIRPTTIIRLVPLAILINNVDFIIKLFRFVIRKIPFINIE